MAGTLAHVATIDKVVETMRTANRSQRCSDVTRHLVGLGFTIRDGKNQGHKIYTHAGWEGFYSASYTCGHGRNPEVKPAYVMEIVKVLLKYRDYCLERENNL